MSLTFILGFILLGFVLLFFELFVPGGVVGTIGGVLIGMGVYGTFQAYGPSVGLPVAFVCSFGVIGFIVWWAKYFPESKVGRVFNLQAEVSKASGYVSQNPEEAKLLGKTGVALTHLRPSGEVEIEGKRVDVLSQGGFIEKGNTVKVVLVDSNRIVVAVPEPHDHSVREFPRRPE